MRRALLVLTPAVSLGVAALGFRLAVSGRVRAADLFVAPQAAPSRVHWQLRTYAEERGVREVVGVPSLRVEARVGDRAASWEGASDERGVAEVDLTLGPDSPGERIAVRVTAAGEREPLLDEAFDWSTPPWPAATPHDVRGSHATAREGALRVDVAPLDGRLVPGAEASVLVRVLDAEGHAARDAAVTVEPEPGLRVVSGDVHACANGIAEVRAVAEHHHLAARVTARDAEGRGGSWYGALSVAPGGVPVDVARAVLPGEPLRVAVPAGSPGTFYLVLATVRGRSGARTVQVPGDAPSVLELPTERDLPAGPAWLHVARTAEGPEHLANATWAAATWLGPRASTRCEELERLSVLRSAGAPLERVLEGLAGRRAGDRGRARRGLGLSLVALLAGAALEVALLIDAARRSRRGLAQLEADVGDDAEGRAAARTLDTARGGRAVALVTLAVLGFLLLAALVAFRAGP